VAREPWGDGLMSRGPVTFKQRDLCAALRATVQAGQTVDRIEIRRDGTIVVVLGSGKMLPVDDATCANEWDVVLR